MIGVARGVSVYACAKPCDMRNSFNTLAALINEELQHDVLTGDVYLFVGRDRKRARVLYFDGTGLCLFSKRSGQDLQRLRRQPRHVVRPV